MKKFARLSQKELQTVKVIRDLVKGRLTAPAAAEKLGVSERHVFRMKARMKKRGAKSFAHGSRGKPGRRAVPGKERRKIEKLLRETYADFTPTFAAEKLSDDHGISRDRKTVAGIMRGLGLLGKEKNRSAPVVHRRWREPKDSFGTLVQFDGSYEAWLEDRYVNPDGSHELCLLASVDDATSRLLRAEFAAHEGVLPVMGFWQAYVEEYGVPEGVYLDKFSTYRMNMAVAAENPDTRTQFARAMGELHVTLHFANSPQAKGRVERLFRTLQDRLVKELRLADICTVEAANVFLRTKFLPWFNRRFARPAKTEGDRHRKLSADERKRLHGIFSRHDLRTLRNDFTVSHRSVFYQLEKTPGLALRPKDVVLVRTAPDGAVTLFARGKAVLFSKLPERPKREPSLRTKNGVSRIQTLAPAVTDRADPP